MNNITRQEENLIIDRLHESLNVAALAGAIIPLTLKHYGIDPAIAGGVILTTVTDVVGFVTFLGLATLCLFS